MGKYKGINSKAVHAGAIIYDSDYGAITPIDRNTASFFPRKDGQLVYPRYSNLRSQSVPARKVAELEFAENGLAFASGMAAITTSLFTFLQKGDHAIFQAGLYGGTQEFVLNEIEKFGIEYDMLDTSDTAEFAKAVKPNTKIIYIETPSNPILNVIDIEEIAKIAKANNLISLIDNTYATPVNQNPIKLGIDVVIHSATKYLNGHSDVNCGIIVSSNELTEKIRQTSIVHGGHLDPHPAYLLERGIKTLGLRVEKQNSNAMEIATMLENHPKVKQVRYPGLASHPNHATAKKQMTGFGGMVAFQLDCDKAGADSFLSNLKMIAPAISLGGIESIACLPVDTSHARIPLEDRKRQGISDSHVRLSIGIEDVEDLIADLNQALEII